MSKFLKAFLPKFKLRVANAALKDWVRMQGTHKKLISNQGQSILMMVMVRHNLLFGRSSVAPL
jgi:hypothetical protein